MCFGLVFNELFMYHLVRAIKPSCCEFGKALELLILVYRNEQLESPAEVQEQPARKESVSEKGKYPPKWTLEST